MVEPKIDMQQSTFSNLRQKLESPETWPGYLAARCPVLLDNGTLKSVEPTVDSHGTNLARAKIELDGSATFGLGTLISPDGYMLTCAHVVKDMKQIKVLMRTDFEAVEQGLVPGRLVWTSDDDRIDLALVKVDLPTPNFFPWAESVLERDLEVITVGGVRGDNAAGEVQSFVRLAGKEAPMHYVIQHLAPVRRGDSGGALVNTRGELVGINSQFTCAFRVTKASYHNSTAIRPDWQFVQQLIEKDRSGAKIEASE